MIAYMLSSWQVHAKIPPIVLKDPPWKPDRSLALGVEYSRNGDRLDQQVRQLYQQ